MEKIVRYTNGTLYSAQQKKFINIRGIIGRLPGDFYIVDAETKEDITNEVIFLAEVEHVKQMKAYDKVRIVYSEVTR